MKNVGIDAIDYYIPNLFVDMEDLSLARDIPYEKLSQGLGLKKMSIPDSNEDTASLAANALLKLITTNKINPLIPLFFLTLVFTQIVIGAFVSGMDAGKIYNSWPNMGTAYFPDDNEFVNLFKLSAFSDPSLVQFIHRNLAYIIGFYYLFMFYKIYRDKIFDLYKSINVLGFFILLQIFLGIITVLYGAQIYIASMHQISSIFLVSSCIYFLFLNTRFN